MLLLMFLLLVQRDALRQLARCFVGTPSEYLGLQQKLEFSILRSILEQGTPWIFLSMIRSRLLPQHHSNAWQDCRVVLPLHQLDIPQSWCSAWIVRVAQNKFNKGICSAILLRAQIGLARKLYSFRIGGENRESVKGRKNWRLFSTTVNPSDSKSDESPASVFFTSWDGCPMCF